MLIIFSRAEIENGGIRETTTNIPFQLFCWQNKASGNFSREFQQNDDKQIISIDSSHSSVTTDALDSSDCPRRANCHATKS
jgi:hypothetical protein